MMSHRVVLKHGGGIAIAFDFEEMKADALGARENPRASGRVGMFCLLCVRDALLVFNKLEVY